MATDNEILNSAYSWYAQQGAPPESALELALQALQASKMKKSRRQARGVEDVFETDVGAIAGASQPGAYIMPEEQFVRKETDEIERIYAPQLVELRKYAAENPGSAEAGILTDIDKGVPFTEILRKLSIPNQYKGLDITSDTSMVKLQEYAAFAKFMKSQKDAVTTQLATQDAEFAKLQTQDAYSKAGLPKPASKGGPTYELPKYQPGTQLQPNKVVLPGPPSPLTGQFPTKTGGGTAITPEGNAVGGTQFDSLTAQLPPELKELYESVGKVAQEAFAVPAFQNRQDLTSQERRAQYLQEQRRRVLYDQLAKRLGPSVNARTPYTDAMQARLKVGP